VTILGDMLFGGESQDVLVDGNAVGFGTGWSMVTTPKRTGVGAVACVVNGSQAQCPVGLLFNTAYISQWHIAVVQSGEPSAAYALTYPGAAQGAGVPGLEVGTDSKVRIVKATQDAGVWATREGLSDWSATALAEDSSTIKVVSLFLDPLTLGSSHVWAWLFIDGNLEWSGDVGTLVTGSSYPLRASGNAAITVYLDDVARDFSTSSGDAPHLVDWPDPEIHRQLAIGETTADSWWKDAAKNNAEYTEWDDAAGNDGDATYNWQDASAGTNKYQRSDGQTEATVGIDTHTVIQSYQIGELNTAPVINIVHRNASGTKFGGMVAHSLGPDRGIATPGASYTGAAALLNRSSGSWSISDLTTIEFGCGIPTGAEHDMAWRVSMCMLQWLTYVDVYNHEDFTTPSLPGGVETTPAGGPVFMGLGAGIL